MQKFSGWTALGVIAVSLVISKYLTTGNFFHPDQPLLLASENSRDFLTNPKPISSNLPKQPTKLSTTLEQEVYEQINEYRLSRHLPPLVLDARISEQARTHSQAMASGQVPFSSQGFDLRSDAISKVIPYQKICENVAYNFGHPDPARAAVNGWLRNSEGSVVDVTGEYELTGIGVATNIKGEYYFTQIFIRRQ